MTAETSNAREWVLVPRELLDEARNIAMEWTLRGRVPECGKFGQIAQDLDAMLAAAPPQPAAVNEAMVERIAALLHEEATGEPWAVAGVAHPGPDRDYYRGLARKIAALAAQQQGGAE